ncbi:ribosome small subunit-dependent GTPase A [Staphylococcus sp. NAM3COL9]|uniref:ribosome small subunit-dependent GTPase A n=1 Tax=Staphylococcus sp. NAM3COL9 TaxID=1667172 RepID=UPI00070EBD0F|nr:ribosome small subunit-dependent GTPase A [Staphylococcus sp. NAM3COL9]KRG09956.1 GTPase [Staphylococcus sp. NAM3COL9]
MKTGRIIKSLSGVYRVDVEGEMYDTKPRGLFRKNKFSPIVGDVVDFEVENITEGYIQYVHDRKNELKRPLVSNVDHLILVMSAVEPDFSTQLLDRFLVIAHSYHMRPRILITKRDLASVETQQKVIQLLNVYENMGYKIQFISIDDDIEPVFDAWGEGLAVLSGQSGVGKSTLLNKYFPELNIETQHISKALNRGRHTTTHVELFERSHGYIADTPGFSALDFTHIQKDELKNYFMEINEYGEQCKFRDCNHINEPKCNVKTELESGNIAQFRYDHYLQLFNEIANRKERY